MLKKIIMLKSYIEKLYGKITILPNYSTKLKNYLKAHKDLIFYNGIRWGTWISLGLIDSTNPITYFPFNLVGSSLYQGILMGGSGAVSVGTYLLENKAKTQFKRKDVKFYLKLSALSPLLTVVGWDVIDIVSIQARTNDILAPIKLQDEYSHLKDWRLEVYGKNWFVKFINLPSFFFAEGIRGHDPLIFYLASSGIYFLLKKMGALRLIEEKFKRVIKQKFTK